MFPTENDSADSECIAGQYQLALPLISGERLVGALALKKGLLLRTMKFSTYQL